MFAGDRADEFAARMAGAPYAGGRDPRYDRRHTRRRRRRARAVGPRPPRRGPPRRHHDRRDQVRATAPPWPTRARLLRVAAGITDETTFLGAHVVPPEYDGRADDYVDLVCGEMLAACAPHARWIDAFCERGAFDADQCRAVLDAGRAAGLGLRLHANQLGHGPACSSPSSSGAPRPTTARTSPTPTSTRWPAATPSPRSCRRPTSRPASRTPTPAGVIDAGATVALATNCNPGSSYTTSMSFCIALAVRDLRMTAAEAVRRGHARRGDGATARRRRADRRRARAPTSSVLDAPSYTHLVYRPGVPLIHRTIAGGTIDPS